MLVGSIRVGKGKNSGCRRKMIQNTKKRLSRWTPVTAPINIATLMYNRRYSPKQNKKKKEKKKERNSARQPLIILEARLLAFFFLSFFLFCFVLFSSHQSSFKTIAEKAKKGLATINPNSEGKKNKRRDGSNNFLNLLYSKSKTNH